MPRGSPNRGNVYTSIQYLLMALNLITNEIQFQCCRQYLLANDNINHSIPYIILFRSFITQSLLKAHTCKKEWPRNCHGLYKYRVHNLQLLTYYDRPPPGYTSGHMYEIKGLLK